MLSVISAATVCLVAVPLPSNQVTRTTGITLSLRRKLIFVAHAAQSEDQSAVDCLGIEEAPQIFGELDGVLEHEEVVAVL